MTTNEPAIRPVSADRFRALREPFPSESIGKLPRVTCKACSDNKQQRHCDKHQMAKCPECGAWMTTAHLHLDYVGHAAVTNRLLDVDPQWSWEPVAFGPDGLPAMTMTNGKPVALWIRLTVLGVTRLGVGSIVPGSVDPEKQLISDALRNAAMRFGVALNLWSKEELEGPKDGIAWATTAQMVKLRTGATRAFGKDREARLNWAGSVLERPVMTFSDDHDLTEAEAQTLLAALRDLQTASTPEAQAGPVSSQNAGPADSSAGDAPPVAGATPRGGDPAEPVAESGGETARKAGSSDAATDEPAPAPASARPKRQPDLEGAIAQAQADRDARKDPPAEPYDLLPDAFRTEYTAWFSGATQADKEILARQLAATYWDKLALSTLAYWTDDALGTLRSRTFGARLTRPTTTAKEKS